MTVPTTFVALQYSGAGTTGPFSVPYQFISDTFLRVRKMNAAGTITTLVLNSDYTVTGAGLASGGDVTLTTALAVGETLEIDLGGALLTQGTDYVNGGKVNFETLESNLDNRALADQWLQQEVSRSIRAPTGTMSELPSATARANMAMGFDATGAPVVFPGADLGAEVLHEEQFVTTAPDTTVTLANDPAGNNLIDVFVEDSWQPTWSRSGRVITLSGTPAGLGGRVVYYERLPFYQPVGETIESALRYGVSSVSALSQTAEFQAAIDQSSGILGLPPHDYALTTSALTGQDRASGAAFVGFGATINGSDKQHGLRGLFFTKDGLHGENYDIWLNDGFTTGVDDQSPRPLIMLTAMTEDVSPIDHSKGKVPMAVTVHAYGSQHASGMRANLVNYSDDGNGNSAIYGRATTVPGCFWSAAVHGETRHAGGTSSAISAEAVSYTNDGSFYGVLVNNVSGGGGGMVPHQTEGTLAVKHDTATGMLIAGSAGTDKGEWRYGIRMRDGALRAADGEGIRMEDAALYQFHGTTSAVSATADIQLEADSQYGIVLSGTYTSGTALRVSAGQAIAWENTNVIKTFYDSGSSQFQFSVSGTVRAAIELDPTPRVLLNGTQVLSTQQSHIADPTADTASLASWAANIAVLLETHGLMASS